MLVAPLLLMLPGQTKVSGKNLCMGMFS
jgi:hypothetical protein